MEQSNDEVDTVRPESGKSGKQHKKKRKIEKKLAIPKKKQISID